MYCLYCESRQNRKAVLPRSTVYKEKKFNYLQCLHCDLIYIDPIPGKDVYQSMYGSDYHSEFYFKDINTSFQYLLPYIEKFRYSDTILDYGCGDASFLKFFQSKGFNCSGLEFAAPLLENLNNANPAMTFFSIDEFWNNPKDICYNFIHVGDVLEHLDNPIDFVRKLSSRLEPDKGIVIFEGPLENNQNLAFLCRYVISWVINKFRTNATATHIPYHITFSNSKNQRQFFKYCGLEELNFTVFETPWPYPSSPKGGIANFAKFTIAKISQSLSKIMKSNQGNRFIYIGKKQLHRGFDNAFV